MVKVLVVEDDPNIVDLIEIHLNDLGCSVIRAADGMRGLAAAEGASFDLIILDLMLPYVDGLEVCRRLRMQQINTPILMLTAKSEEIDKVLGLETGADDYLTKPFSIRELIARVKAILRRTSLLKEQQKKAPKNLLDFGDLISRNARFLGVFTDRLLAFGEINTKGFVCSDIRVLPLHVCFHIFYHSVGCAGR